MYKTSVAAATDARWSVVDGAAVLERAGIGDGIPFVLSPDGSYDVHLNRFVRELDSWGAASTIPTVEWSASSAPNRARTDSTVT